jgi:hypothetical protein
MLILITNAHTCTSTIYYYELLIMLVYMCPEYSLQQHHQPTITAVRVELLYITNASTTGANQPWRKTVADGT